MKLNPVHFKESLEITQKIIDRDITSIKKDKSAFHALKKYRLIDKTYNFLIEDIQKRKKELDEVFIKSIKEDGNL